jgi:hypothetical protein
MKKFDYKQNYKSILKSTSNVKLNVILIFLYNGENPQDIIFV